MKHSKTSSYTLTEEPALKWMIIVSVAVHVCVLMGALVIPNLGAAPTPFEPAYSVELVDMPAAAAPKAAAPAPKVEKQTAPPEPQPDPTPRVEPIPETVEPEPIPIVKKPRSQKVAVQKAPTEKRITEQLKRIEKQTEQEKQEQSEKKIDDVIAKLRKSETTSDSPASGAPSGNISLKLQLYKTRIWNKVRGNWSYPDILAAKKGLEAVVLVSVSSEGKILSQKLIKPSGDPLFDQSVVRAVKLSDPLPPFPDGYVRRYEELELRFNLAEMARIS